MGGSPVQRCLLRQCLFLDDCVRLTLRRRVCGGRGAAVYVCDLISKGDPHTPGSPLRTFAITLASKATGTTDKYRRLVLEDNLASGLILCLDDARHRSRLALVKNLEDAALILKVIRDRVNMMLRSRKHALTAPGSRRYHW